MRVKDPVMSKPVATTRASTSWRLPSAVTTASGSMRVIASVTSETSSRAKDGQ